MNLKKHIPNAITCGNLLCGCLATVSAFHGNLICSAYLVALAAVLDFFDGFAARLLHVHSEIGKQLDSLADVVTFGLVPGVIMFALIAININPQVPESLSIQGASTSLLPYLGFTITIFSALRLAKFNIDTRQSDSFIGVPTPANALLICSLPLINFFQPIFANFNVDLITNNIWVLVVLTFLMSYLMIAELPLFALKFKSFTWADNKIRYSFLIISVLLLILFQFIAIPFVIFLYIILSIGNNISSKYNSEK